MNLIKNQRDKLKKEKIKKLGRMDIINGRKKNNES